MQCEFGPPASDPADSDSPAACDPCLHPPTRGPYAQQRCQGSDIAKGRLLARLQAYKKKPVQDRWGREVGRCQGKGRPGVPVVRAVSKLGLGGRTAEASTPPETVRWHQSPGEGREVQSRDLGVSQDASRKNRPGKVG